MVQVYGLMMSSVSSHRWNNILEGSFTSPGSKCWIEALLHSCRYCRLISNHNTTATLSRWETFDLHMHPQHSFVKSPLLSYRSLEMTLPLPPPLAFLFFRGKAWPSLPADVIRECCSDLWDKFLYKIYKPWKQLQFGRLMGGGGGGKREKWSGKKNKTEYISDGRFFLLWHSANSNSV